MNHPGLPNIMSAQSPVLQAAVLEYAAECYKRGYRQGLEDAAKACESMPLEWPDQPNYAQTERLTMLDCAKTIREMKP